MIAQPLAIYSDRFCDDCYIRFPVMLQTNNNKKNIFRIWYREKKLARLLFDFGAVKITDDDCEQQVPNVRSTEFTTVDHTGGETTVVLGLQQLWSDANSNRRLY